MITKDYAYLRFNLANPTGTLVSNTSSSFYIVESVYIDPNTSVTGKEMFISCGSTFDTRTPFIAKGSGNVTAIGYINTFYKCYNKNIYGEYSPTTPSSTAAIVYYTCSTQTECDNLTYPMPTNVSSLVDLSFLFLVSIGFFSVTYFIYKLIKK